VTDHVSKILVPLLLAGYARHPEMAIRDQQTAPSGETGRLPVSLGTDGRRQVPLRGGGARHRAIRMRYGMPNVKLDDTVFPGGSSS
jgi:hypothetical protein